VGTVPGDVAARVVRTVPGGVDFGAVEIETVPSNVCRCWCGRYCT
jgi:hypothetical protein